MPRCRLYHLAIAVQLLPAMAAAQGRTIRGVVVDSGGKTIPLAIVVPTASERGVETDENGRFRLQLESSETCSLFVRRSGYHSKSITLGSCPDTLLRIVLARAPVEGSGPRCGTRSTLACEAPNAARFESIAAGPTHSCGLERNGSAWCWGDGRKAGVGDGSSAVQRWPQRVSTDLRFAQIAAGGNFTCAIASGGAVHCWGTSEVIPGWPKSALLPVALGSFEAGSNLTAGRRHACLLAGDGRASCWGWNVDGETGTGSSGVSSSLVALPSPVLGSHRFGSISAGSGFTCGVTVDGRLLCWGSNIDGVLGEQTTERCGDVNPVPCSSQPVEITAPEPMQQISSGTSHACTVSVSGVVYCWGSNDHGQLGQVGPPLRSPRRVPLNTAERFASVASGGIETCAITTTNVLYCWGADYRSTRLTGLSNDEVGPRRVATGVRNVAMGQLHFCAVTTGGSTRCWGDTILGAFGVR